MTQNKNILLLDPMHYPSSGTAEKLNENPFLKGLLKKLGVIGGGPKPRPKPRPRDDSLGRQVNSPSDPRVVGRNNKNKPKPRGDRPQGQVVSPNDPRVIKPKTRRDKIKDFLKKHKKKVGGAILTATVIDCIALFEEVAGLLEEAMNNRMLALSEAKNDGYIMAGVANIDSEDPDILYFKQFFTLFRDTCYDGESTSIDTDYEWQDPGNYCIHPSIIDPIEGWYESNRSKFIEEFFAASNVQGQSNVVEKYFADFSTIMSDEISIDAAQSLEFRNYLSRMRDEIIMNPFGLGITQGHEKFNLLKQQQLSGNYPCFVDSFVLNLPFCYSFLERSSNQSKENYIKDICSSVAGAGPKAAFDGRGSIKSLFSDQIFSPGGNSEVRNKWLGLSTMIFRDPLGKKGDLSFWTNTVIASLEAKKKRDGIVTYRDFANITLAIGRDAVIAEALARAFTRNKPTSKSRLFAGLGVFAADIVINVWDPFEFHSVRDEVYELFQKSEQSLLKMAQICNSIKDFPSYKVQIELKKEHDVFLGIQKDIITLLHNLVRKGVQKDSDSDWKDDSQVIRLANTIQKVMVEMIRTSQGLDIEDMTPGNWRDIKSQLSIAIDYHERQLTSFNSSVEAADNFNLELGQDAPLGPLIKKYESQTGLNAIDAVDETNNHREILKEIINMDMSASTGEEMHKSALELFMTLYGFDAKVATPEILTAARDFRRLRLNKLKTLDSRLGQLYSAGDSFGLDNKVKHFIRWWRPIYDVGSERGNKDYTIHDTRWATNGFGLKTPTNYYYSTNSLYLRDELTSAKGSRRGFNFQALSAIGLSYFVANTSFYYLADGDILGPTGFVGGSLRDRLKQRSRTKSLGQSQGSVDKGLEISGLGLIFDQNKIATFLESTKKWNEYGIWLNSKLKKGLMSKTAEDIKRKDEYKICRNLATVFYREQKKYCQYLSILLKNDILMTNRMKELAAELSRQTQPGKENHMNIVSTLQKISAVKLAYFEAAMELN